MNERGKPEAVWPARWMAPNKTKGKNHANPPSTRARVPAPPRGGRTMRRSTCGGSELNRACKPDDYDTEQTLEPEHMHGAVMKAAQEPVRAQAPTAAGGPGKELGGRRQRQHQAQIEGNRPDSHLESCEQTKPQRTLYPAQEPTHDQADRRGRRKEDKRLNTGTLSRDNGNAEN